MVKPSRSFSFSLSFGAEPVEPHEFAPWALRCATDWQPSRRRCRRLGATPGDIVHEILCTLLARAVPLPPFASAQQARCYLKRAARNKLTDLNRRRHRQPGQQQLAFDDPSPADGMTRVRAGAASRRAAGMPVEDQVGAALELYSGLEEFLVRAPRAEREALRGLWCAEGDADHVSARERAALYRARRRFREGAAHDAYHPPRGAS